MSLYGAENGNCLVGDNALLGYGSRQAGLGDETSLTYYITAWVDSGVDYTPEIWEEYRLITHTSQGRYTIIKNPSSADPKVIVDRSSFIGTATSWAPVFMAAWSSSNGTGHPPVYIDDVEIKSLISNPDPLPQPYTVAFDGTRFTQVTTLTVTNTPVGDVAIDPRDNTTILFATDVSGGSVYRAQKVAAGNWQVDPNPVVTGLDRPSGLAIESNGTLWWSHDYNNSYVAGILRLKAPWAANTPEVVVADFGDFSGGAIDDDAIDLTVAPDGFNGSLGKPGMIIIADRGSDGDANNAVYYLDPATPALNQTGYSNFLVLPTPTGLGSGNLNAITPLPQFNEVVTVSTDGFLTAIDAEGVQRNIWPSTLWADPFGPDPTGLAIAADPQTGRLWVADDLLDEIWSVSADPVNPTADQKELSFPLSNPERPERQLSVHDPGMAFSPDGKFLVLSDTSTVNGGGRLLIFHNEIAVPPDFRLLSIARTAEGVELKWEATTAAKYRVLRCPDLATPGAFVDVSGELTGTTFTDKTAPTGQAFYRVQAIP
jgi:sugar lactone lactonase YvrE